ncbi:MAG: hypothetical protein ABIH48_00030 [Candidatus Falkowbacteria bacterium]
MAFIIFLLTAGALAILTTPLLKREKLAMWTGGGILISSIIVAANSTYRACSDGWASHSIGRQGACSWHGGVVSRLTDFGWIALVVSLAIIGIAFLYLLYKEKKEEKKKIINTSHNKEYEVQEKVRK